MTLEDSLAVSTEAQHMHASDSISRYTPMRQARTCPSKHMAISSGVDRLAGSTQWNSAPLVSITLTNIMLKEKPGTKKRYDYTDVKDKGRKKPISAVKSQDSSWNALGWPWVPGRERERPCFWSEGWLHGCFRSVRI